MPTTRYFDYEGVAREAGIESNELRAIRAAIQQEFPADPMLFELHVLRACMAVRDGHCSAEDIIEDAARGKA